MMKQIDISADKFYEMEKKRNSEKRVPMLAKFLSDTSEKDEIIDSLLESNVFTDDLTVYLVRIVDGEYMFAFNPPNYMKNEEQLPIVLAWLKTGGFMPWYFIPEIQKYAK